MANGKQAVKIKRKIQKIGDSYYFLIPSEYIKVFLLDTTETVEYEVTIKEPNGNTNGIEVRE